MINFLDYPFINVSITFYFEVKDADMYGGKGSTGYCSSSLEQIGRIDAITDQHINDYKNSIAEMHGVSADKVRFITKDEYEANTED